MEAGLARQRDDNTGPPVLSGVKPMRARTDSLKEAGQVGGIRLEERVAREEGEGTGRRRTSVGALERGRNKLGAASFPSLSRVGNESLLSSVLSFSAPQQPRHGHRLSSSSWPRG